MPAGKKDALYDVRRANLNWADLYRTTSGNNCRELEGRYRPLLPDYVFVNSRTGLTDVGGICTLHLPDLVVMMFALNEQNVRGVAAVARTIRESKITGLAQIPLRGLARYDLPREDKSPFSERWTAAASLAFGVKTSPRSAITRWRL